MTATYPATATPTSPIWRAAPRSLPPVRQPAAKPSTSSTAIPAPSARLPTAGSSAPLTQPQSLTLTLSGAAPVQEVRLTFDTDLSHEIQPSLIKNVKKRQVKGLPHELVRDYDVELLLGGAVVAGREMRDNGSV